MIASIVFLPKFAQLFPFAAILIKGSGLIVSPWVPPAAGLAFDAATPGPKAKTNWLRVVDHYHQFKVENGLIKESTWQKEYVPRLSWLVETVSKADVPSNGKKLLEAMR